MAIGFTCLWLQQVVPDIRPREIEVTSNAFQDLRPQQKLVPNAIVRCLDLLKGLNAIDAGERHENQQSTKSGNQHPPAIHRRYEADPGRRHRLHFTVSKRNPETECRFKRHSYSRSANHSRRSMEASCAVRILDRSRSSSIGVQSTSNTPSSRAPAINSRSTRSALINVATSGCTCPIIASASSHEPSRKVVSRTKTVPRVARSRKSAISAVWARCRRMP